jgi:hypothetical protein
LTAFAGALLTAVVGGIRRSRAAWMKPPSEWPRQALPWAMMIGALAHAFFETWLLSAGNANNILVWVCILLLFVNSSGKTYLRRAIHRPRSGEISQSEISQCT